MAKAVDLLSYWMPALKQLREFREIAKTEEIELNLILEAIDRTLANMFIETADEYGISRFEQMMGIYPNKSDGLEARRLNVLIKWGDKVSYTDKTLYDKLSSLCGGADKFKIVDHYEDYLIEIVTHLGGRGALDAVQDFLVEILPCNLVLNFSNVLEEISTTEAVTMASVTITAFNHMITNDIKENVSTAEECSVVTAPVISTARLVSISIGDYAILGGSSVLGNTIL